MSVFLLDTHILLWALEGNEKKLGKKMYERLQSPEHLIWVSVVSAWEITVKSMLGKLSVPKNLKEEVAKVGFQWLSLELPHVLQLKQLPAIHNDPFDRLLVAQAQITCATLLSHDALIAKYDVVLV